MLTKEIIRAALYGDLHQVVKWLQKGGHVDAMHEDGIGLLHAAAAGGRLGVAKELLQRGASVDLCNPKGATALISAAANSQHAMVRLLLQHKASVNLQSDSENDTGGTALMGAAWEGNQECVQELLDSGASTELRGQDGRTALGLAEGRGHAAIAQLLQQHAATPPASVTMVLPDEVGVAVCHGELQPVVEWLQQGGHVDALAENGTGLLHAAAEGGRLRVAKGLLQRGASVDLCDIRGTTALMMAATQGKHAMVRLLLEHKAGVNLQSAEGYTALMATAFEGHTECVQELLQAGASTELRDQDGCTALGYAETHGHAAIAKLLRQHAAKPPATLAAPTPNLSGRRVRIGGLQARPELNGRCGVAGRFDAAKGRYAVTVEGEAEAVLLKPANLQEILEPAPSAITLTLNQP